jgi:hypothetical protein
VRSLAETNSAAAGQQDAVSRGLAVAASDDPAEPGPASLRSRSPLLLDQLGSWGHPVEFVALITFGLIKQGMPPPPPWDGDPYRKPLFGRPSVIMEAFLSSVAKGSRCFQFYDADGERWWVQLTKQQDSEHYWTATGFGGDFLRWIIDTEGRERYQRQLEDYHGQFCRIRNRLSDENRRRWANVADTRAWMQIAEGAARLARVVQDVSRHRDDHDVQITTEALANAWWGADQAAWPRGWRKKVLWAIRALGYINVKDLSFPRDGSAPFDSCRRPALTRPVCHQRTILHFQVDPRFANCCRP